MSNTIKYQNQEWDLANNHLAFINVYHTKTLSDFQFIGDFEIIFANQDLSFTETRIYSFNTYQDVITRNTKPYIIFWFKTHANKSTSEMSKQEWQKIHEYSCNSHIEFEFSENELTVNSKFYPFYSQNI